MKQKNTFHLTDKDFLKKLQTISYTWRRPICCHSILRKTIIVASSCKTRVTLDNKTVHFYLKDNFSFPRIVWYLNWFLQVITVPQVIVTWLTCSCWRNITAYIHGRELSKYHVDCIRYNPTTPLQNALKCSHIPFRKKILQSSQGWNN